MCVCIYIHAYVHLYKACAVTENFGSILVEDGHRNRKR